MSWPGFATKRSGSCSRRSICSRGRTRSTTSSCHSSTPAWARRRGASRRRIRLSDMAERGQYLRLFLTSFAALYVEIMLIRWVGTEFRLFAYFQNLTLIAWFLGFGYGCFRATKRPVQLFDYVALCAIAILIEIPWRGWARILEVMGAGLSLSPDVSVWHDVTGHVSWAGFTV